MASLKTRTKKIRRRKSARAGSDAKKARENKGTTPSFPIHKDAAKSKS
ncbi:MAG: hypothetical protein KDA24_21395 [Deltaproteobacteria bacterium]|nr:hypothetical protein [Deltaproteobacteria bacterium]